MLKKYEDLNESEILEVKGALSLFLQSIKHYDEIFKYLPDIEKILYDHEDTFEKYDHNVKHKKSSTISEGYVDVISIDYAVLSGVKQKIKTHKKYCEQVKKLISND